MAGLAMKGGGRYTVPDAVRGAAVISMVLYHAMWDIVYMFGVPVRWYDPVNSAGTALWQASIAWTFILLSGFCWALGRHKLRRGLMVLVCSVMISAVTAIFTPASAIRFGILTLLGTAMLVTIPLDRVFGKVSPYVGLAASGLLFAVTRRVEVGRLGIGGWSVELPGSWYANDLTAYLGLPTVEFSSSDYVPLVPWLFLFWVGYFAYRICAARGLLRHLSAVSCPPLEWVGRRALLIYMLHQPVIYGMLWLYFNMAK